MHDTCRITRPGDGPRVQDQDTLEYTDPAPAVVYEGKCRIPRRGTATTSTANNEDTAWDVGEYPLDLPVEGSAAVQVGHTVTYLTSATDPALEGLVYGITDVPRQSEATARRFRMKQIVGG